MSRKKDSYYFENFVSCVECSTRAAKMLQENLIHFRRENLKEKLDAIHQVEHDADRKKHEMMAVLVQAFITPIEREDIILLSQCLDEVTDKIEDVMIRLYIDNVRDIRPEAIEFATLLIQCCEALSRLMQEFEHFKKSKVLSDYLIRINELEEQGDQLYIRSMRRLHKETDNVIDIITWREIFTYLEKCCDACEHVADAVESVIMKNT